MGFGADALRSALVLLLLAGLISAQAVPTLVIDPAGRRTPVSPNRRPEGSGLTLQIFLTR